jgi:hypothetical protein
VAAARFMVEDIDQAYLDFCCTFEVAIPSVIAAYSKLRYCNKLAITFCLRGNKKEIEDYKFDLLKKIQNLFEDFKLEYATAYRDGAPMVGLLLSNRIEKHADRTYNKTKGEIAMGLKIYLWCETYARKTWGHNLFSRMWGEPEVIDHRRRTHSKIGNVAKIEDMYNHLPEKLEKELETLLIMRNPYGNRYYEDEHNITKHEKLARVLFNIYLGSGDRAVNEEPYLSVYSTENNDSVFRKFQMNWASQSKEANEIFLKKCVDEYEKNHRGDPK